MEHIPNYDNWKTTEPELRFTECIKCGAVIYKQDHLKTVKGYVCEECLELEEEEDEQE